jgi:hypothetical protein
MIVAVMLPLSRKQFGHLRKVNSFAVFIDGVA